MVHVVASRNGNRCIPSCRRAHGVPDLLCSDVEMATHSVMSVILLSVMNTVRDSGGFVLGEATMRAELVAGMGGRTGSALCSACGVCGDVCKARPFGPRDSSEETRFLVFPGFLAGEWVRLSR